MSETLWQSGAVRELQETTATGGVERELDEHGTVVRDDEVFEDGSRKAVGR